MQPFAIADVADELLTTTAPHHRALLKLLAVADRHSLDPVPLISSLAEELSSAGKRIEAFAQQIESGLHPVEALEQNPGLLPLSSVLALRLARDNGTLPELYSALLNRHPDTNLDAGSFEIDVALPLMRMAGRVLAVFLVLSFIMLKIVPEFQKIMVEFEIETPAILFLLLRVCNTLVDLWFVPVLLAIIALLFCFPFVRQYMQRWSPLKWRQPRFPSAVNRKRSLALVAQMASSMKSGLAMMLESTSLKRILPRLGATNERIEKGQDPWESLHAAKLISKQESQAMSLATSGETQAWLLRRSAEDQQIRRATRNSFFFNLFLITAHAAIAFLVVLTCLAVFMTYINLAKSI